MNGGVRGAGPGTDTPHHEQGAANHMRIGILGLGRIGAFHAETLAGLDSVGSLVVADPFADAAKAAAERFGAEVADSPEAVFAAGVDGVVIAAATDAHPDLILAAVEAGVPVFCEKPVARTMAEGVEVLKALAGRDVPVQIGYQRRFDTGFAAARPPCGAVSWDRCTPYGRRRWTRPHRPPRTSPPPGASSGTARCTTSTRSAG